MKAIVCTKYGPPQVLELQEVTTPVPKDNEILIKVHSTTVTAGDCEMRSFSFPFFLWIPLRMVFGVIKPRKGILGQELAGEVVAAGKAVTKFKKGDRVFAATLFRMGTYAEYQSLPETYPIAVMPASMSYEEATTIPTGGINALHFIRKANIQPGQKVLINGAGGSIGTYAVQLAKLLGAEVTCVDSSPKLDMLRTLGADYVIDYTQQDFTQNGKVYDVIIDIVGKSPYWGSVRSLSHKGHYIIGNLSLSKIIRGLWTSLTTNKKVISAVADYTTEDFLHLIELIENEKIKVIIDKNYPLEQIPEAHDYVDKGEKKGNVVITVA